MNDMQKELLATFAETFVDSLSLDVLLVWADILSVEHDFTEWLDDDYPEKDSELRGRIVDAFLNIGDKK